MSELDPLEALAGAAIASDVPEAEVTIGEVSAPGEVGEPDHEFGGPDSVLEDFGVAGCYRLTRGDAEYEVVIGVGALDDPPPGLLETMQAMWAAGIERELG